MKWNRSGTHRRLVCPSPIFSTGLFFLSLLTRFTRFVGAPCRREELGGIAMAGSSRGVGLIELTSDTGAGIASEGCSTSSSGLTPGSLSDLVPDSRTTPAAAYHFIDITALSNHQMRMPTETSRRPCILEILHNTDIKCGSRPAWQRGNKRKKTKYQFELNAAQHTHHSPTYNGSCSVVSPLSSLHRPNLPHVQIGDTHTHTVAFSVVGVVPCAVTTTDESIDFLRVSCFSGVNSFRLIMCSDACESTTHSLALRFFKHFKETWSPGLGLANLC